MIDEERATAEINTDLQRAREFRGSKLEFVAQRANSVREIINDLIASGQISKQVLAGDVIDLGAWAGGSTLALRGFGGDVVAVDQSKAQLEEGLITNRIATGRAVASDAETYLARRSAQADVIAFFGMSKAADPQRILRHAKRLLRPGGVFLLTTMGIWEPRVNGLLAQGGHKFYPNNPYEWDQVGYIFIQPSVQNS